VTHGLPAGCIELGSGDTIVLVHGVASTPATWVPVIADLARTHRCICPALPGHGSPAFLTDKIDLDSGVAAIEDLRRFLGLETLRLAGHSLGAMLAARYAAVFPKYVAAVALLATPAFRTTADRDAGLSLLASMRKNGIEPVLSRQMGGWYTPEFAAAHPAALSERLAQIRGIAPEMLMRAYAVYVDTEIAEWLGQILAPTLVLSGEAAVGCGAAVAGRMAAALRRASLVIVPGQRNGLLTEVPVRVAEELREFFRCH